MIGESSTSLSSAIARSGSSGHKSLQSIEERRLRQRGTQVLALLLLKEDEVDGDYRRSKASRHSPSGGNDHPLAIAARYLSQAMPMLSSSTRKFRRPASDRSISTGDT